MGIVDNHDRYLRRSHETLTLARVDWRGLSAEVMERTGYEVAEFRVHQPRHVFYFNNSANVPAMELRHGGGPVRICPPQTNRTSFTPADVDYWGVERRTDLGTYLGVFMDPEVLTEVAEAEGARLPTELPPLIGLEAPLVAATLTLIDDECRSGNSGGAMVGHALAYLLAKHMLAAIASPGQGTGNGLCDGRGLTGWRQRASADWRVRRAMEYLEARLAEDVALCDVALAVGITTTHLTTLFRAGIGEPPHRWLMRRRFERSCELLADPRCSITDVAHACGFASSQHLATVFRRRVGVTPSEYRQGYHERLSCGQSLDLLRKNGEFS